MPVITGYDLSPKHKASVLVDQGNRCAECGEILGVHKAHLWYEHMVATALCVTGTETTQEQVTRRPEPAIVVCGKCKELKKFAYRRLWGKGRPQL
jgi:hypothetical protein